MITTKATIKAVLKKETGRTDYAVYLMLWTSTKLSPKERTAQKCYIRIGSYRVLTKQWNERDGLARPTYPYHTQLNQQIHLLKKQALDIVVRFEVEGAEFDAKKIKRAMYPEGWEIDFFDFVETQVIPDFEFAKQLATADRYRVVLNKIEQCIDGRKLGIGAVTPSFLAKFDQYMLNIGNEANTRRSNHKKIAAVLNVAIKKGVIKNNPYTLFDMPKAQFEMREGLTLGELQRFAMVDLPVGELIDHVRDIWLFCFLSAGMRISDALTMKKSSISNGAIRYKMRKTATQITIPVSGKLQTIVEKYSTSPSPYLFPFVPMETNEGNERTVLSAVSSKTTLINKYLPKIAKLAGIDKKVTTHIARHTAAELLGESGMGIKEISAVLAHDSVSTTEAYVTTNNDAAVVTAAKILSGLLVD